MVRRANLKKVSKTLRFNKSPKEPAVKKPVKLILLSRAILTKLPTCEVLSKPFDLCNDVLRGNT